MSVLWAGNMRGPRIQARLVLLLLLSGWTRTVLCQDEDPETGVIPETTQNPDEEDVMLTEDGADPPVSQLPTVLQPETTDTEDGVDNGESGSGDPADLPQSTTVLGTGEPPTDDEGLDLLLVAVPAALVVLFIVMVVCGVVMYRRRSSKSRNSEVKGEDPYLHGSSEEKVPMPMFEEDVPSVLELEMDELDDWMKKDGELTDFSQQA